MATQHRTAPHELTGDPLIGAAQAVLVKNGEQWTQMREAVFAELARHHRPVSAYDIADQLSRDRGRRVAPNSIYRILDLFVANNLAHRVESANAYLANPHPASVHDCIFLVCDKCGEAAHIDDETVSKTIRALAASRNFTTQRPVMEVRGLCKGCS